MAADTMKLSDELETRIRAALEPLHPGKAILFGSCAWGQIAMKRASGVAVRR